MRQQVTLLSTAITLVTAVLGFVGSSPAIASESGRTPSRTEVVETQLLPATVKRSVRELAAAQNGGTTGSGRLETARQLIEAARASGDPRPLGYAEQILANVSPSVEALVLWATIEQSRHGFESAQRLLDRALAIDPADLQALLTRASVAQVSGHADTAIPFCRRIEAFDSEVASLCMAQSDALQGLNERAFAQAMRVARSVDPARRAWALSITGDIRRQDGNLPAAIAAYAGSVAISADLYTRVALADALNADRQPLAALAVLERAPATDAVLLQRWRALRGAARSDAAVAVERELDERLTLASTRPDFLHLREAALFTLERGDAVTALQLAQRNWRTQREPADVLLLASAARAAGDPTSLREVRAWTTQTGLRDRRVETALAAP